MFVLGAVLLSTFDSVIAEALQTVRGIAGRTVTFTQKATGKSVVVVAVPSTRAYTAADRNGVMVRHILTDWLVAACDLVIDGKFIEPVDGDTIIERVGAKKHTHSVSFPNDGDVFRYSDTGRTQLRIHTVDRGVTNA